VKRLILVLGVSVAVLGSGLAAASVLSRQGQDNDSDDGGIHGGPISRFHTVSACKLTDVSTLPGNWTHGDYVSAVAAGGDPAQVPLAAHSECGKPMVAVGHGGGPPAHALENMAAGKAHAGGEADDAGSDAPGS
jgi:hypothetical protein